MGSIIDNQLALVNRLSQMINDKSGTFSDRRWSAIGQENDRVGYIASTAPLGIF
jgi:hypothetical protein